MAGSSQELGARQADSGVCAGDDDVAGGCGSQTAQQLSLRNDQLEFLACAAPRGIGAAEQSKSANLEQITSARPFK